MDVNERIEREAIETAFKITAEATEDQTEHDRLVLAFLLGAQCLHGEHETMFREAFGE